MKTGKVAVLPDGTRTVIVDGEPCPSFMQLTTEDAWIDDNNIAHLGKPTQNKTKE